MTKIKLSIETLRVESFATAAAEREKGTIFGNAQTLDVDSCSPGACGSAIDACPSSPHAATLPCNGCVDSDPFGCVGSDPYGCALTDLC